MNGMVEEWKIRKKKRIEEWNNGMVGYCILQYSNTIDNYVLS